MRKYNLKTLEYCKSRFAYTNNFEDKSNLVRKGLEGSASLNLVIMFSLRGKKR